MPDAWPLDFSVPVAKVRNYIPDTVQLDDPLFPDQPPSFLFSDAEIQSFIDDETQGGVLPITGFRLHRAAAWAIIAIANNENLILKKITSQDQTTDGTKMAQQFIAAANAMFARANEEERMSRLPLFAEGLLTTFPEQTDAPDRMLPWISIGGPYYSEENWRY